MPLEFGAHPKKKIAVIGGGISGMAAAHLLGDDAQVVLFEDANRLGGHARTLMSGKAGTQPVDTGFIVFNYPNYPHLTALFEKLDVPVVKSSMTFGASIKGGRLEYGTGSYQAVVAQPKNMLNPKYIRFVRDIFTFNKHALAYADSPEMTIGGLLEKLGTSAWFRDYYILPLSGAIWSVPPQQIMQFPAQTMIGFFENHALLSHSGQHQWYTVKGGSIEYVTRLADRLRTQGVELRLNAGVTAVRRTAGSVEVAAKGAEWERFDEVVFATHSDTALALLADASTAEQAHLGAIKFQSNTAVLHADPGVMPKSRRVWSSWNYCEGPESHSDKIDLTYWMNSLQPIPQDDPMFVTLNSRQTIAEDLIYDQTTFQHPIFDRAALDAQAKLHAMNGTNNTWFAGAWMHNGFHEDGFKSAVDVVRSMTRPANPAMAAG